MSKALDTLREGKFDVLADMVAARLIAVDTATRQGLGMEFTMPKMAHGAGMHISCWPLKSTESRSSEPAGKVRGAERRHVAAIGRKNLEEKERAKMRKASKEASGKEKEAEAEDGRIEQPGRKRQARCEEHRDAA